MIDLSHGLELPDDDLTHPETPDERKQRIARRKKNPVPRGAARSPDFNPVRRMLRADETVGNVRQPVVPEWMKKPLKPAARSK